MKAPEAPSAQCRSALDWREHFNSADVRPELTFIWSSQLVAPVELIQDFAESFRRPEAQSDVMGTALLPVQASTKPPLVGAGMGDSDATQVSDVGEHGVITELDVLSAFSAAIVAGV